MPSLPSPSRVARFGIFEADFRTGELRKAGIRIKLHDQSLKILGMLLEQPGELITREEIQKALWPGDTFVDFDHGLNNAVNRLRDALADSVDSPRWIETLPRRGYRFVGHLNGGETPETDVSSEVQPSRMQANTHESEVGSAKSADSHFNKIYRRLFWVALAAAVATVLIIFGLQKSPVVPSSRSFLLPPDNGRFNLVVDGGASPILSSDGTKIAFVALNRKGLAQIWVRPLGKLSAEPLEGTEGSIFPFWSPDARWIGFFAGGKLKKVKLDGGPAVTLCDAPLGRGGSWNREGVIIFAPSSHSEIYKIPDSGGVPAAITKLDDAIHTTHRWPKFLPDGTHFIYMGASHFHDVSHNGVYLSILSGEKNSLLVSTDADATYASGYLFFLRKNVLMAQPFDPERGELKGTARSTVERVLYDPNLWKAAFDASTNGVMAYQLGDAVTGTQLCWFDRTGEKTGVLGEPAFQWEPRISPDGRKVAAGIADGRYSHIGVYELARGVRMQVTYGKYDNGSAVWTADGSRLIFTGKRKHYSIYQVDSGGAAPEQLLLDTGNDAWPLDLSPDGKFLIFGQGLEIGRAKSQLWVYSMKGNGSPVRLLEGDFLESDGQFSPDGHWVAYTSNQSGREEVYIIPFREPAASPTQEFATKKHRVQISLAGGHRPRWRRDGKELFYTADDNTLMAAAITRIGPNLEIGAPHPLFRAIPNSIGYSYDVSPGGNRFIIASPAAEKDAPITLVENWPSDFKNK